MTDKQLTTVWKSRPSLYFSIEASELGLAPGDFPQQLEMKINMGPNCSLIAYTVLIRNRIDRTPIGDIAGVLYCAESGNVSALVIND